MYLTDDQVINKLYEEDYEAVIMNYMDFAHYLADRYARRSWTHEAKDIRGEAVLALVEGVQSLKGHANPRGFLTDKIRGAIINYVTRKHTIHIPQGKEQMYSEEFTDTYTCSFDPSGGILAAEILNSCVFSSMERNILKMKIEGSTLEEIAIECKMPYSLIQRTLQGTQNRVRKLLDGTY